jgi:predicted DNA-binding protein
MKSARANICLTEEMYEVLTKISRERGVPLAYLVREAVAAYVLEQNQITVNEVHPGWGGRRSSSDPEQTES